MSRRSTPEVSGALAGDEVREILRDTFFKPAVPAAAATAAATTPVPPPVVTRSSGERRATGPQRAVKPRPEHYKVICISMYTEDLARLDAAVRELKRRGYTKANRSAVLRVAMEQLDLDRIPKGL